MAIDVLQEVTEWDLPYNPHNGIYHVNGAGQLVAYQGSDGVLKRFKNPLKGFSKTRRKFVKLEQYEEELPADVKVVEGSNGNKYYVQDGQCTCPGFKFRGKCKHI